MNERKTLSRAFSVYQSLNEDQVQVLVEFEADLFEASHALETKSLVKAQRCGVFSVHASDHDVLSQLLGTGDEFTNQSRPDTSSSRGSFDMDCVLNGVEIAWR
jgi:hypothetical protein